MIKLIKMILTIIFTYFIFYLSLYSIAFKSEKFYHQQFSHLKIYDKFPNLDINSINKNVLSYLQNKHPRLVANFFNNKEIEHLKDVRQLFTKFYKIFLFLFLLLLVCIALLYCYTYNLKQLISIVYSTLISASIFTIFIVALVGLMIYFDFDDIFIKMHNIFFTPGTWVFNYDDNIVNLYVEEFFYNIAVKIVKTILTAASCLALIAFTIKKLLHN